MFEKKKLRLWKIKQLAKAKNRTWTRTQEFRAQFSIICKKLIILDWQKFFAHFAVDLTITLYASGIKLLPRLIFPVQSHSFGLYITLLIQ